MLMQCLLQFTPNIMRSLYMLCRVLVLPSSSPMTRTIETNSVHLVISLIIGKLEALQSTKICTQSCRAAAPDKFGLVDDTDF